MNCPINDRPELLIAYAAGELDSQAMSEVREHLAVCPECREMAEAQSLVWQALDEWDAPPLSADFNRRLYQRIQKEAPGSWWSRLWTALLPVNLRQAVPLAAGAALLLTVGLVLQPPHTSSSAPSSGEAMVRADQVENVLDDLDLLRQSVTANDSEGVHADAR
jgi:anti-sigma factor RsiW